MHAWATTGILIAALTGVEARSRDADRELESGPRGAVLELREHAVHVQLTDGFAQTRVEQVLVHTGSEPSDVAWSLPLPEEAALSELSVWIDGQRSVGEVVRKQEADRIYEEEREAGNQAGRLERQNYKRFTIDLANVPGGGEVRVTTVYYQALEVEAGIGRYVYPLDEGGTEVDMDRAFWSLERHALSFTLDVDLHTSFPIDDLHCPSHAAFRSEERSERSWHGSLREERARLERDFVLFYRLRADEPARVELLTHRAPGAAEGTFLAVVTPGEDLAPIVNGIDWLFLLDVSGSMQGDKIRMLSRGVRLGLEHLSDADRFQVLTFSGEAQRLTHGWLARTSPEVAALDTELRGLAAGGSTNLFAALSAAYALVDGERREAPVAIVLVSDGVATAGPENYRDFIELAREHDLRLFTFALGNGANERLLEDLSTLSGGFAKSVSVREEIGAQLMLAADRMSHEALHGVEFELAGSTDVVPGTLPSLYLGQQLRVFGRYDRTGPSQLTVRARISGEPREWTVPVVLPRVDESNPELERLWALTAIGDMERQAWLGHGDEGVREVTEALTDMALRYSLVTDETALIVVPEERKALYGLGDDNARRRDEEERASARRAATGPTTATMTGAMGTRTTAGAPLAGQRAAHAPTRAAQGNGAGRSGGGGAVGPLAALPLLGLLALRRRRRRVSDRHETHNRGEV